MIVIIYFLRDPVTKELRYIGRTKNDLKARLRGHIAAAKRNVFKTKKDNWILKLRKEKLKPIIEYHDTILGWTESYIYEQKLIRDYINMGFNLVNLHDRGEGALLRIVSEEQKKKISNKVKQLHKDGVYDSRGLKLTVYDLNGYKIQSFKNIRETATWLNVSQKQLDTSLKRESKRIHEYQVRRFDTDKIESYYSLFPKYKQKPMPTINSVNCLENPEEDNQQPSSCGDTEKGSTTSSESQVDNNSTTKAEQMSLIEYHQFLRDNQPEHLKI
jgi:hypothetical protein